jgi:ParB family chromosome partitioning protein
MRLSKERVASVVGSDYARDMLEASDRAQAGNPAENQVWDLLVSEIEPDPDQPRKHFDQAALRDLADDIAARGVLQPIVVRRVAAAGPDDAQYRIVFGERRWRASMLAGAPRIPCLVREMNAREIREAQLVENVVRQDISDVERGVALRGLYEAMKAADRSVTWDTVAKRVGLSRMRIHHLHALSSLPAPVIELIQSGRLSGSHGTELARLNDEEAQVHIAGKAARPEGARPGSYALPVAEVRERVNAVLAGAPVMPGEEPARPNARNRGAAGRIERHLEGVASALRPDMSVEVRERLRRHAQDILRFLDGPGEDPKEAPADGGGFVKTTLQTAGREHDGTGR